MENDSELRVQLRTALSSFTQTYSSRHSDINTTDAFSLHSHRFFTRYEIQNIQQSLNFTADDSLEFKKHVCAIYPLPIWFTGLKATKSLINLKISAIFAYRHQNKLIVVVGDAKDLKILRKGCIKHVDKCYLHDFRARAEEFLTLKDPKQICDTYTNYCVCEMYETEELAVDAFKTAVTGCGGDLIGF